MWIDTHTHFDAHVFAETRVADWAKAQSLGVSAQFVMGVAPFNFAAIEQLANDFSGTFFALGIHPMYVMPLELDAAIVELERAIARNLNHPRFIGIGEIGLDGFVDNVDWDKQVDFLTAQLKLARDYDLPVFMHVRKSQDMVLKYCRQLRVGRGIAHAFNGSVQQADNYLAQGFKLGFGGALTFERAKNLRRLATNLPIESFVVETDAPDMPPAWAYQQTNYSYHLPQIAEQFAQLRDIGIQHLSLQLWKNTETAVGRTLSRLPSA